MQHKTRNTEWRSRHGKAGRGQARRSGHGEARRGEARRGEARLGEAVTAGRGKAGLGWAWRSTQSQPTGAGNWPCSIYEENTVNYPGLKPGACENKQGIHHRFCTLIQRADGYGYSLTKIANTQGEAGMGRSQTAALSLPGLNPGVSRATG